MKRFLLTALAALLVTCQGQSKKAAADKGDGLQPLSYTVRSANGSRTSQDRESVLRTLKMTDNQVREWVEAKDDKAVKEKRSATWYRSGYMEMIGRAASGQLQYTIRDRLGSRTCRDREAVLKTVKMTPDQLKTWTADPEANAEARAVALNDQPERQITVRNSRASVTSRDGDSAAAALKLADDKLLEWVKDKKAAKQRRAVTFAKSGYLEAIWRDSTGQLLYGVRTSRGNRTSRDRDSVLKTIAMTEAQVRAWAEDEKAAKESRCATFAKAGYVEMISRGRTEEPPQ